MVVNYQCRFEVRPGKYAYVQTSAHRDAALKSLEKLKQRWMPPGWYYHFARGGHVAAAREHLHNRAFARLDIERFFASVTKSKLIRSLKRIGTTFLDANEFAASSTVRIDGRFALPYGFVQSPFLATLALAKSEVGKCLTKVRRSGVSVTVYVDDILLSHPESEAAVEDAMKAIYAAAARAAFDINAAKAQGPAHEVNAFNIRMSYDHMQITDERFNDFRSAVIANGVGRSSDAVIRYVASVNTTQAERLVAELS